MKNKKGMATTLVAIGLTAVLTLGSTLAYLSTVTETKTNTFSSSKNIHTKLDETFNPEEASSYRPGQAITKAPTLANDSESAEDIWVAASLEYTNGAGNMSYEEFKQYAEIIDLDTTSWIKIATGADGSDLYMFKTKLAKGETTDPAIFQKVQVNTGIKEVAKNGKDGKIIYTIDENRKVVDIEDNTSIVDSKEYYVVGADGKLEKISAASIDDAVKGLPTFEIKVTGYAVQATDISEAQAKTELINLANNALQTTFTA